MRQEILGAFFNVDEAYLKALVNGPTQISEKKDLSLGIQLSGSKQKDFFKFLCGKNLSSLNLSTPQR